MKKRKIVTVLMAMLVMLFCFSTCASAKSSIKLNAGSKTITVGKTYTLKATVKGKKKKTVWKSSNTAVATVNQSGKVTAKKAGKATITAEANGKKAKCTIKVKAPNYAKQGIYEKTYGNNGAAVECLVVLKASGGKVKFVVEHYGRYGMQIYQTNTITTKLNNNKTGKFKWKDSWGNSGTGKLIFKKNKVTVKMNVTKQSSHTMWLWHDSVTMKLTNKKLTSANKKYYSDLSF